MSYIRVIPRDLFNESSLLKCLGRLYIALEKVQGHRARFTVEDVDGFDVQQSEDDGSISVTNLPFAVGDQTYHLSRPLNSRQPWPLWLSSFDNSDFEPIGVFDDHGELSSEMQELIK